MEKVNEYKFELACCIALSAVGINFWRELQVTQNKYQSSQLIKGLTNYSSSCYMNSLLQMLATMPEYIEALKYKRQKTEDTKLTSTLHSILNHINQPCSVGDHFDGSSVLVNAIRRHKTLEKWNFISEQQDCSEFWQKLNHLVEGELFSTSPDEITFNNIISESQTRTEIRRWTSLWPHRFLTIRKMTCNSCKNEKEDRLERHEMLSLIRQPHRRFQRKTDLELSLDEYFGLEQVSVDCDDCKSRTGIMIDSIGSSPMSRTGTPIDLPQHDKETFLASMPDYLCCQINSQVWDAMSSTSFKSQQVWSYPERINMGVYSFHIHAPVWYNIEAVIIHLGGAHCGHYLTWRKVNHRWYECNDQRINLLADSNGTGARSPYMLLYKKEK